MMLGQGRQGRSSGTPNNGLTTAYTFDKADNRSNVTVTGAATNSPPSRFIVVPLNEFTLIPIS